MWCKRCNKEVDINSVSQTKIHGALSLDHEFFGEGTPTIVGSTNNIVNICKSCGKSDALWESEKVYRAEQYKVAAERKKKRLEEKEAAERYAEWAKRVEVSVGHHVWTAIGCLLAAPIYVFVVYWVLGWIRPDPGDTGAFLFSILYILYIPTVFILYGGYWRTRKAYQLARGKTPTEPYSEWYWNWGANYTKKSRQSRQLEKYRKKVSSQNKVRLNCPHCGAVSEVIPFPNERVVKCKSCPESFVVPAAGA